MQRPEPEQSTQLPWLFPDFMNALTIEVPLKEKVSLNIMHHSVRRKEKTEEPQGGNDPRTFISLIKGSYFPGE